MSSTSMNRDAALQEVVDKIVKSEKRFLFIVGASRYGKSTRLPALIAKSTGDLGSVICVQADGDVARCHARYAALLCASQDAVRIGFCEDSQDIPTVFPSPDHDVTYVSYRWLYRLVLEAKTRRPSGEQPIRAISAIIPQDGRG
ncbi:hypothetical protein F4677DRAFT_461588 [Hypoxylon crocopeplum]|nr:hypothetical protein F4677DRAFT_461588 [Hypoxylon crocopeplum]